jgi:hypothetical protein
MKSPLKTLAVWAHGNTFKMILVFLLFVLVVGGSLVGVAALLSLVMPVEVAAIICLLVFGISWFFMQKYLNS